MEGTEKINDLKESTQQKILMGMVDKINLEIAFIRSFVDVVFTIDQREYEVDLKPLAFEALKKIDNLKETFNELVEDGIKE